MHNLYRPFMSSLLLLATLISSSAHTKANDEHEHFEHSGSLLSSAQITQDHAHESGHETEHKEVESHDSTKLSKSQVNLSGIQTNIAATEILNVSKTLYGVIQIPQDKSFRIYASYESLVKKVHVSEGQRVNKGQLLLTLSNKQTLQTYTLTSPSDGEVTKRYANTGDHADENVLLEITDLSHVWVELSAFPKDINLLSQGQSVWVHDMHLEKKDKGEIIYIAPIMSEGHIARARASLKNEQKHWRAGMHIKADIQIDTSQVTLAVKTSALQTLNGNDVVFTKHGDTFKSTQVKLGKSDGIYTEIISGLSHGDEYVSENSYIVKADIKKDGASHNH